MFLIESMNGRSNSVVTVGVLVAAFCLSACLGDMPWRRKMVVAKTSLRKIEAAQKSFRASKGNYATLPQLASAGLINGDLSRGISDAYRYEIKLNVNSYEVVAVPVPTTGTPLPAYLLDGAGVIHHSDLGEAEVTVDDPVAPEG